MYKRRDRICISYFHHGIQMGTWYLAGEGAEVEGLLKDSVTGQANVSRALERPGLRPWLQEYHFGTVYSIGLHTKKKILKKKGGEIKEKEKLKRKSLNRINNTFPPSILCLNYLKF